jgi:glycosyltransferase involved in cell wall biosynthesis
MNYNPKISIITIVFNSEALIEKTILSIINQTYKNTEYIIVDGGSTDETLTNIDRYKDHITTIISEPDNGIYDAMNKGLNLASGDFVWFINSGDEIFNPETLEKIFESSSQTADILYGDAVIINTDGEITGKRRHRPPEKLNWKSFRFGMLISHQSILVRKTIAPSYDLNYKGSADFDWLIKAMKTTNHIENTHLILSKYLQSGYTKKYRIRSLIERAKIMCKHYGLLITLLSHFYIIIRFSFQYLKKGKSILDE